MKYTKTAFGALLLLMVFNLTTTPTRAQVEKVVVRVDGMSCPFCAYGLEKKMKKVEGAEKVTININDGTAELIGKRDPQLNIDALKPAVKDAGFTPRDITITVSGMIAEEDEAFYLALDGATSRFALSGSDEFQAFAKTNVGRTQQVRVVGKLESVDAGKRQDIRHYAVSVETFEVIK